MGVAASAQAGIRDARLSSHPRARLRELRADVPRESGTGMSRMGQSPYPNRLRSSRAAEMNRAGGATAASKGLIPKSSAM